LERGRPRWHNPSELQSVVEVLRHVRARPGKKKPTLAVLSPYKAQVDKLHSRIESLRETELAHLDGFNPVRPNSPFVGTVDSFQGSEADLVIISLVRNNPRTGFGAVGFLRDQRRMNVALSRAKSQLVLVGSLKFLEEAVRGVNPDDEKHALSFLTRVVETIRQLEKENRASNGVQLATVISPDVLGGRR
jgi:superfamily I DNA and/or RNA helicase